MAAGLDMYWPGGELWLELLPPPRSTPPSSPPAEICSSPSQISRPPLLLKPGHGLEIVSHNDFALTSSSSSSSLASITPAVEESGSATARKVSRRKSTTTRSKRKDANSQTSTTSREEKNTKERTRVKNIREQYNTLREVLGQDSTKKLCKQRVLDSAIQYITNLMITIERRDTTADCIKEESDLFCKEAALSSSSSDSSLSVILNPNGQTVPNSSTSLSPVQGYYQLGFNFYGQTGSTPSPFLRSPNPLSFTCFQNQSYLPLSSPPLDITMYHGNSSLTTPEFHQYSPPSSYEREPLYTSPPSYKRKPLYMSSSPPPPPLRHISMLDNSNS